MQASEEEILRRFMTEVVPFHPTELEPFFAETKVRTLAPGESFCEEGKATKNFGVVLSGLFRIFSVNEDGLQTVRRFAKEASIIGDLASLISRQPARVTTQAIETSLVSSTPYSVVESLYSKYGNWQLLGRLVAERYYVLLERRVHEFLSLTAKERYQVFRSEDPELEGRLSKGDIAAYLGITPQSFSRILSAKR